MSLLGRRAFPAWLWLALLMTALVVRRFALFFWQHRAESGFGFPDSESYWYLAQQILAGADYEFGSPDARVFRTPGYPLLLAGWMGMGRPLGVVDGVPALIWARGLSVLLGLATLVVAVRFTIRTLGARTAAVAGLLVALHPECVFNSILLLSEPAFALGVVLQTAAWFGVLRRDARLERPAVVREQRRRFYWECAAVGLLGGLTTLLHPSWIFATPLLAGAVLLLGRADAVHRKAAMAMLAAFLLAMSPWWARNAWAAGTFVPTTLQSGASLYDGWRPDAEGNSDMRFVPVFERKLASDRRAAEATLERWRQAEAAEAAALARKGAPSPELLQARADRAAAQRLLSVPTEVELDRRMQSAAIQWARENPFQALRLAAVKVLRQWNPSLNESSIAPGWLNLVLAACNLFLWSAAAWGAWRLRNRPALLAALVFPAWYLTAIHTVFVGSVRYRLPAVPALCVLAAVGLATPARRLALAPPPPAPPTAEVASGAE